MLVRHRPVLSFVNDRYLRLQTDIGLLLAVLTTLGLWVLEVFVPSGAIDVLRQPTQSFNLNDELLKGVLCFMLFRGSVNIRRASLREQRWLVLSLAVVRWWPAGGLVSASFLEALRQVRRLRPALLHHSVHSAECGSFNRSRMSQQILMHPRCRQRLGGRNTLAAALMTWLLALVLLGPLAVIGMAMMDNVAALVDRLRAAIQGGLAPPDFLADVPLVGSH